MFSVKTENILLNYFVVLFTFGLLFFYHLTLPFLLLFIFFVFCGVSLYFDRYFFFKISFIFLILLSILYLFHLPNLNILVLLVLFISLSQIYFLFSYFLLLIFLNFHFEFLGTFLVVSILVLILISSFFLSSKTLNKEFNKKLFSSEAKHRFFVHDICNLFTVLFLKNKDRKLEPILNKMKLNLRLNDSESKSSAAGLLRMTIYFLNYDYNLKVKQNFFLVGENLSWVCFFYNLLENYTKKGSTVVVDENSVFVVLKKSEMEELQNFLQNQFVKESVEIKNNVLKFTYGM
jgi:hypothetical protein